MLVSTVEIPRVDNYDDISMGPAWSPCVDTSGKKLKPLIRCSCGRWSGIGLHHVHADGTVTRSFYHKKGDVYPDDPDGCGWHVFLKLKDYDQGDFPPEPRRA
jgi:hypothetical protein